MRRFGPLLLSVLLAGCGSNALRPPEEASATAVQMNATDHLDGKREFRRAVVGQRLRGDGIDVTVVEDGALVGRQFGQPFVGSWEYVNGAFCTSLRQNDVRNAKDRRCYNAAIHGNEILLSPYRG